MYLKVKRLINLETSSITFHNLRTKQFKITDIKKPMHISMHSCILRDQKSWVILAKVW